MIHDLLSRAADVIAAADALLIVAGSGISVDRGLARAQSHFGLWRQYPVYRSLGLTFPDLTSAELMERDPALAWGFYGHRLMVYRSTTLPKSLHLLKSWGEQTPGGCFVVTSNVDGAFYKAGFGCVIELGGSVERLQCTGFCQELFSLGEATVLVNPRTMRAQKPLPSCPRCGALARPNIMMSGDSRWNRSAIAEPWGRFEEWSKKYEKARLAVLECGVGGLNFLREPSTELTEEGTLIRINTSDAEVPERHIGLWMCAHQAISLLHRELSSRARYSRGLNIAA